MSQEVTYWTTEDGMKAILQKGRLDAPKGKGNNVWLYDQDEPTDASFTVQDGTDDYGFGITFDAEVISANLAFDIDYANGDEVDFETELNAYMGDPDDPAEVEDIWDRAGYWLVEGGIDLTKSKPVRVIVPEWAARPEWLPHQVAFRVAYCD